ncbi:Uncharacterised protein [Legionella pneumophila]|nr:Uncharacterised protein [Legionella pneumophila]CZG04617.1 Uncharacterised protein [Legionella pneumophila]
MFESVLEKIILLKQVESIASQRKTHLFNNSGR